VERCVELAIRNNIALYACHTNLDSVQGGTSWCVGEMLGLESMRILEPRRGDDSAGYGVVGELPVKERTLDFLKRVKDVFNVGAVRYSDIPSEDMMVGRVAICTGAGRSNIDDALSAQADVYITADLRYNDFMCGENRMILADIGHFESEFCAIRILDMVLSKKMCNFAVRKSERSRNPIHYLL
jgi:putative NIF3 family GTP cyclohydrolase 1 type 2